MDNNKKQELYELGQILNINENEINATLKKKKRRAILAILLALAAAILLTGCLSTFYTAVAISDFSWIWRIF